MDVQTDGQTDWLTDRYFLSSQQWQQAGQNQQSFYTERVYA